MRLQQGVYILDKVGTDSCLYLHVNPIYIGTVNDFYALGGWPFHAKL